MSEEFSEQQVLSQQVQQQDSKYIPKPMRFWETTPISFRGYPINQVEFAPINGTQYSQGQLIKIAISSSNGFLNTKESYLRLNIKGTLAANSGAAGTVRIASGHACIKRLRVYTNAGNVELERIDDYNYLTSMLLDAYSNDAATKSSLFMREGYGQITSGITAENNTVGFSNQTQFRTDAAGAGIISGYDLRTNALPVANASTAMSTVSFSLMLHASGILGPIRKYLPLPLINQGITLELLLAPPGEVFYNNRSAVARVVGSYLVTDIAYVATLVTPDEMFLNTMKQIVMNRGLSLKMSSFRFYQQSLSTYGSQTTVKLVDTLKSVKGYLGGFYEETSGNGNDCPYERSYMGLQEYYIRYNNMAIPQTPIVTGQGADVANLNNYFTYVAAGEFQSRGIQNALANVLNVLNRLGDTYGGSSRLNLARYAKPRATYLDNNSDGVTAIETSLQGEGSFLFGQCLEQYGSDNTISGLDLSRNNINELQLVLKIPSQSGNINQVTLRVYLYYDMDLKIQRDGSVIVVW